MTMPPQNAGAYCPAIREFTDAAPSKLPALTMTSMVNSTTISMADRMTCDFLMSHMCSKRSRSVTRPTSDVAASPADSADTTNRMGKMALFHSGYAFTTPSKKPV